MFCNLDMQHRPLAKEGRICRGFLCEEVLEYFLKNLVVIVRSKYLLALYVCDG